MTKKPHGNLGRKQSAETRAKQSAAGKRRWGDPVARFFSHIRKDGPSFDGTPCWVWKNTAEAAKKDKNQEYAHLNWNGKYRLAHRVSLEIAGASQAQAPEESARQLDEEPDGATAMPHLSSAPRQ